MALATGDSLDREMRVWLIEPYYTGSHQAWAEGYQAHSAHSIRLLTLPGRFWKWRMDGGGVTLARMAAGIEERPDVILASDMLNVPVFLGLAGEHLAVPVALYLHENQLTYPLQPGEKRDLHYGLINLASGLRADALFFNSAYHRDAFFDELPRLLKHFPDYNELWAVDALRAKAQVLPLGLDLARLEANRPHEPRTGRPVIVWNHRWEYDKDPDTFFRAMYALAGEGLDFGLILLGESWRKEPAEFLAAREGLAGRIVHFGYVEDAASYARLLWQADIVVSTALHEFFGAAVVEACYCDCFPVLPRRLTYPELIPPAQHETCLYTDFDGLLARLRGALTHVDEIRQFSLREELGRYDWARMAPRYDEALSRVRTEGPPSLSAPTPCGRDRSLRGLASIPPVSADGHRGEAGGPGASRLV
jgi:glycosyltransferase involved in cell wall biosynthesis